MRNESVPADIFPGQSDILGKDGLRHAVYPDTRIGIYARPPDIRLADLLIEPTRADLL